LKAYSGLDDETLKQMAAATIVPLSGLALDFKAISFLFLPEEAEDMDALFKEAIAAVSSKDVYLARMADYDRMLNSLSILGGSHNVTNTATALMLMLNMFERRLPKLTDAWFDGEDARHKGWIPIESMFGNGMPSESAAKVAKAVAKIAGQNSLKPSEAWKALEIMAERSMEDKK